MPTKNTLVVIGWLGNKSCYLNVPREEAIQRYLEHNRPYAETREALEHHDKIQEFEFEDQFGAYDVFDPN